MVYGKEMDTLSPLHPGSYPSITEENPVGMKREVWDQVYKYCVEGDYDFMYINVKRPRHLRVMKNFEQFVYVGKD